MARPANTELVAVAWLKTVAGIGTNVATTLPEDLSSWEDTGFIRVGPVVGGDADLYVNRSVPVIQLEAYAFHVGSKYPDWALASDLLMYVQDGLYDASLLGTPLTLRTGYRQAYVQSASWTRVPHRAPGDPGNFAVMRADLALAWLEVPE